MEGLALTALDEPQGRKVLGRAYGVLALVVAMLLGSLTLQYHLVADYLVNQKLDAVEVAVEGASGRLEADLAVAQASVGRFGNEMSFHSTELSEESIALESLTERSPDGALRSRRDQFDARVSAGIWIPASVTLDDGLRRMFVRAWRITNVFRQGPLSGRFANSWVLPLVNGEVAFFPDDPEFIFNATPETDYRATPWVQLTSPAQNRDHGARWTPISFDETAGQWMVSVVAPFFKDGIWAGSVGHDLLLKGLLTALTVRSAQGTLELAPYYVVRTDGQVLLHQGARPDQDARLPADLQSFLSLKPGARIQRQQLGQSYFLATALPELDSIVIYRQDRLQVLQTLAAQFQNLQVAMGFFVFLIVLATAGFISRDLRHRQVERQLLEVRNSELETLVQQRTQALTEANEKLESLALQDHLTGLSNRRAFDTGISQAWDRAQRRRESLSLVMLDVDHFKQFNDALGHPEGDVCLRAIARVIKDIVHRPDDLACRYGGEEFALILPATEASGALRVAELLRLQVMAQQIKHPRHPLGIVTVSLGVAELGVGMNLSLETLLSLADAALYRAKERGRNRTEVAKDEPTASD
jgi:diguanylate cyclase (GGDEF)-like protein